MKSVCGKGIKILSLLFLCFHTMRSPIVLLMMGNRVAQQGFGFVMLGYRNASVLVADRGMFNAGKTFELGFVRCIEKVMSQTTLL